MPVSPLVAITHGEGSCLTLQPRTSGPGLGDLAATPSNPYLSPGLLPGLPWHQLSPAWRPTSGSVGSCHRPRLRRPPARPHLQPAWSTGCLWGDCGFRPPPPWGRRAWLRAPCGQKGQEGPAAGPAAHGLPDTDQLQPPTASQLWWVRSLLPGELGPPLRVSPGCSQGVWGPGSSRNPAPGAV